MSDDQNNGYADSETFKDNVQLGIFRVHKASEYFNIAAQKASTPDMAKENKAIADMLEKAMTVGDRVERTHLDPTAEEMALLEKFNTFMINTWADNAKAEQMDNYAASKISQFAAAQPEVWQRLIKTDDEFVARAKQYLKP